jgi:hypothetical protein
VVFVDDSVTLILPSEIEPWKKPLSPLALQHPILPIVQATLAAQMLVQSIPLGLLSKRVASPPDIKQSGVGYTRGLNDPQQRCVMGDMRRGMMMAWLWGLLGAMPLSAQETASVGAALTGSPVSQLSRLPETDPASLPQASTGAEVGQVEALPSPPAEWQSVWGVVGLRAIPAGPRVASNGEEYHPNFSMDLNFNFWMWRSQGLYLFADMSLWGEKGEYGVTNGRDGFVGTSKREFNLSGGAAWNYAGPWEARAFGYTDNNLNRGLNLVSPAGFTDGFGLENRYYLSPEYAKMGQPGFDVAKATFLSFGYYPSKDMVGNDGQTFQPGLMLRAYLTYDLWDWPCYAFGDATYISERSFQPKLLLFDLGFAARPFRSCQQCEFRLGVDSTADLQVHNVQNLWYASFRFIF